MVYEGMCVDNIITTYLGHCTMNDTSLVVGHALVDGLTHEGVREAVEDVVIADVQDLEELLRLHIGQDLHQTLGLNLILEGLNFVECLQVEDVPNDRSRSHQQTIQAC